jgi:hypothetical protein
MQRYWHMTVQLIANTLSNRLLWIDSGVGLMIMRSNGESSKRLGAVGNLLHWVTNLLMGYATLIRVITRRLPMRRSIGHADCRRSKEMNKHV